MNIQRKFSAWIFENRHSLLHSWHLIVFIAFFYWILV